MSARVSLIAIIHESRNQGVAKEIFPLTLNLSDPQVSFSFLNRRKTVRSVVLEALLPEEGSVPAMNHNEHSIELEAQTSAWSFWASKDFKLTG